MAIQFYLTNVGRTAALNATLVGLDLQIKHIAVGSGQYNAATAAPTKTALTTELERYLVNGGEIEPTTHTLRFTVNLNSTITADIYEIGLFDENNVLFAVAASTSAPLVQLINEVITIITFGFSLDDVDNITLMLDVNSPLAVTLMNQHTAHEHPHAQYKRINDDTERLKVSNGTDLKDAVNKEQLDAEATARSNADTNLQNTKAALNGDNTQRFKVASAIYADEAITKLQLDNGLSSTFGMLNLANKADINGNLAQVFSVAAAISDDHAVRKSQLDTKANKNGNIAEYFNVAPATLDSHAVTKTQLDSATSGLSINLSGKADKNGSSTELFHVASGTDANHAVNKGQLDAVANSIPTVPGLATDTTLGLVQKATLAGLQAGTANVWPDAQTIFNGFALIANTDEISFKLVNGLTVKIGKKHISDITPGDVRQRDFTINFNASFVSARYAFLSPYTNDSYDGEIRIDVIVRELTDSSLRVFAYEHVSIIQDCGFYWLVIGY